MGGDKQTYQFRFIQMLVAVIRDPVTKEMGCMLLGGNCWPGAWIISHLGPRGLIP